MDTPLKKKTTSQTLHLKARRPAATQSGPVTTVPPSVGNTPAEAPLPHERDESVGMTDGIPSEPVRQAYRDLQRGLQDTDRGPVADRAYKKLK